MLNVIVSKTAQKIFLACFLVVAGGCGSSGPELAPVSGKVTMDGKALANVLVTFTPVGGGTSSSAVTDQEGRYTLSCHLGQGALVGQHRVSIHSQAPHASGQAVVPDEDDPSYQPDPYASIRAPAFEEKIPARYNTKSELLREVKRGKNVIDLELTSQP